MSGASWISPLCFAAVVGVLIWLFLRRRYLAYLLLVFIVAFASRLVSALYLDISGPVYSVQLFRDIGPGRSVPPLAVVYVVYIGAFLFVFRRAAARSVAGRADQLRLHGAQPIDRQIAWGVLAAYLLFVVLLFADFFRTGVVPLFAGLERFEYTAQYGGRWHQILMRYGMLLSLPLGVFCAYGAWFRGSPDYRFLAVLLVLFGYLFLAGHRFSAFYSHGTAFLIPWTAVRLWQELGTSISSEDRRRMEKRGRLIQILAVTAGVCLIGAGLYRSYYVVRDTWDVDPTGTRNNPFEAILHRVLVQPGELWFATWERVFVNRGNDPAEAVDRLFVNTIADPDRNSTIPYLMVTEIGSRADATIDAGSAYAGGFPEIFFELFGPVAGYPAVIVVALVTAWLSRLMLLAMVDRRYLRVGLVWYVMFALVLLPLGGMLNFLVNWKFWVKVGALTGWVLFERERERVHAHELRGAQTVS